MSEQEAVAYIEEWDVTEAAKVLKWYEEDELLRPCDCDTIVAIETENLHVENAKLRKQIDAAHMSHLLTENENESLRELVRLMWKPFCWAQSGCEVCLTDEQDAEIRDKVRELGVEVNVWTSRSSGRWPTSASSPWRAVAAWAVTGSATSAGCRARSA